MRLVEFELVLFNSRVVYEGTSGLLVALLIDIGLPIEVRSSVCVSCFLVF